MQRRKWMPKKKQIELLKDELLIIKSDLLKVMGKLDQQEQGLININFKLNQHKKKGHIPREIKSNSGTHIISTSSDNSGGGTTGDR